MARDEAFGICQHGLHETGGENPGGGLACGIGHFADTRDCAGAILRRGRDCGAIEMRDFLIFLRPEHRQQVGIFRFVARQADRSGEHAAKRFFVGLIGGGARGAAIYYGADGNAQGVLGDVLVDGVIGEARQRVHGRINFHFGFVGVAPADDAVGDVFEF